MEGIFEKAGFQTLLLYTQADAPIDRAEDYRDRLLAAFAANARGDSGPFWAMFDPDMVFHVSSALPYGGAHHGLEAVRAAHRMAHDCYDAARVEVENLLFGGDIALAYLRFNFRIRKNGLSGVMPMVEAYRFRGGRVVEWRAFHFDAGRIAEMLAAD